MFFNKYPYTDFHELNLDFLIATYKGIVETIAQIDGYIEQHEPEYEALKAQVDKLESGDFTPEFVNSLIKWYEDHILDIIGEMAKMVIFNVTDDGYFVAYIPEAWSDIMFGTTGLDDFPPDVEFGHLTISY